MKMTKYWGYF